MEDSTATFHFEYNGIPLRDWLWRLVDDDRAVRVEAATTISDIWQKALWVEHDPPCDEGDRPFRDHMNEITSEPNFNTEEFLSKVGTLQIATLVEQDDAFEQERQRNKRWERLIDRARAKVEAACDRTTRKQQRKRLKRITAQYVGSGCDERNPVYDKSRQSIAMGLHLVVDSLDAALLTHPDILHLWLDHPRLRSKAISALIRLGKPAAPFATRLIDEMDDRIRDGARDGGHARGFDGLEAITSIGKGDPFVIDAMIQRLRSDDTDVAMQAQGVLGRCGTEVCGRHREIVDIVLNHIGDQPLLAHHVYILGSVGRQFHDVRALILKQAGPHEPRMVTENVSWSSQPYVYDAAMQERGMAISSLAYFVDHAEDCIPVLRQALIDFKEYDPDMCYDGPHGRVAEVAEKLGPGAAALAPYLVAHMQAPDAEFPKGILRALSAMGPAAHEVLPSLFAMRIATWSDSEPLPDLDTTVIDEYDDLYGWTIQRIRGQV